MRLTSVLLRDDDTALERRVCESDKSAKTYADAADWLSKESASMRRTAQLLETAASRLAVVLQRCEARLPSIPQGA